MSGIQQVLMNSGGELVKISAQTARNNTQSGLGGTATATYRLSNTGSALASNISGVLTAITGEWLLSGAASAYEARGTWSGAGGTVSGPTTWSSLGTTRDWTMQVTGADITMTLALEIGLAGTSTAIATATITFNVNAAP